MNAAALSKLDPMERNDLGHLPPAKRAALGPRGHPCFPPPWTSQSCASCPSGVQFQGFQFTEAETEAWGNRKACG